jgi:hypothetical protein
MVWMSCASWWLIHGKVFTYGIVEVRGVGQER